MTTLLPSLAYAVQPTGVQSVAQGSGLYEGSGSPEGVVVAPPGSIYTDLAGHALYIKASGELATGWESTSGSLAGRLIGIQTIIASGTYTPTVGTAAIYVQAIGAGGGSGGIAGTAATLIAGGGGGGGAVAESYITSLAASYDVTIGAAGAAGASGNNAGGAGGTTTFGTALISCPGGAGSPGNNVASGAFFGIPGAGGAVATGGTVANRAGESGGIGINDATSLAVTGFGGASPFGTGGSGRTTVGVGNVSTGYGAGAGGSYSADATNRAGQAGGAGVVRVWEYS